ncbi:MAG: MogA/MoaB family molybdenum cofactor biosynthesis protein [Candidatus Omnitrophota bacterium]|nr:MogA/MoaB family molybdenum cofactor biosynthesis protein [Candidatus Omnitrophota bacterium]
MLRVAILTISDSCFKGLRKDQSGPAIKKIIEEALQADIAGYDIVADEKSRIKNKLVYYADKLRVNLVLTTGGTGLSLRDVTPEATREVVEREVPGIAEFIRADGLKKTKRALLSRSIAGLRGETLIVNLPGSLKGASESLEAILDILPHAFDILAGKGH